MLRRVAGSVVPILLFLFTLAVLVVFYLLALRGYLQERIDPIRETPKIWMSALGIFFYLSVIASVLNTAIWFVVSILSDPEPVSIRFKWCIFFVISLLVGVAVPIIFLVFHDTNSGIFNTYIFLYFFLVSVLTYFMATIISRSDIRGCSGFWKIFGR